MRTVGRPLAGGKGGRQVSGLERKGKTSLSSNKRILQCSRGEELRPTQNCGKGNLSWKSPAESIKEKGFPQPTLGASRGTNNSSWSFVGGWTKSGHLAVRRGWVGGGAEPAFGGKTGGCRRSVLGSGKGAVKPTGTGEDVFHIAYAGPWKEGDLPCRKKEKKGIPTGERKIGRATMHGEENAPGT